MPTKFNSRGYINTQLGEVHATNGHWCLRGSLVVEGEICEIPHRIFKTLVKGSPSSAAEYEIDISAFEEWVPKFVEFYKIRVELTNILFEQFKLNPSKNPQHFVRILIDLKQSTEKEWDSVHQSSMKICGFTADDLRPFEAQIDVFRNTIDKIM